MVERLHEHRKQHDLVVAHHKPARIPNFDWISKIGPNSNKLLHGLQKTILSSTEKAEATWLTNFLQISNIPTSLHWHELPANLDIPAIV